MRRQDVGVLWYLRLMAIIGGHGIYTLRTAIDRGFEFYPIEISDFGDVGALNPDDLSDRGIPKPGALISNFAVRGIRIAADSAVDRCYINYNPGQVVVGGFSRSPGFTAIALSHERPWIGSLTAPLYAQAMNNQMYFDDYVTENGVATKPFGRAFAITGNFVNPRLKLELLLRGSGNSPAKRMAWDSGRIGPFTLTGGGTEDDITIFPASGRKRGRWTIVNPFGNPAAVTMRVTAVSMSCPSLPFFTNNSWESEIVAPVVVAAGATETVDVSALNAQWTILKVSTAGAAANIYYGYRFED